MQQAINTTAVPVKVQAKPDLTVSAIKQIFGAIILGGVLLYGVGFASMDVVHNAAHDARHAFAFPCH